MTKYLRPGPEVVALNQIEMNLQIVSTNEAIGFRINYGGSHRTVERCPPQVFKIIEEVAVIAPDEGPSFAKRDLYLGPNYAGSRICSSGERGTVPPIGS